MSAPKVYLGTPVQSGAPMLNYVISLIVSLRECHANGWPEPILYFRAGDSDVARARNAILGRFLKSDCTDLVLIDSDISWPPGTFTRLVTHKKDFVSGAYRGRTDEQEMYFIRWPQQKEMWTDPDTGNPLLKADGVPLGFCRLKREVIERLFEATPHKRISDPIIPDEEFPWIIDFEWFDGARYEEGYSLCKKWRDLGGEVWVDPMINLGHMGPKIFESDLMGFLARMTTRFNTDDAQSRIEEAWLRGAPKVAAE